MLRRCKPTLRVACQVSIFLFVISARLQLDSAAFAADELEPLRFVVGSLGDEAQIVVYFDQTTPPGLELNLKKRKREVLGGDRTGVIVARFIPRAQDSGNRMAAENDTRFAWVNVVVEQKHTKPVRDQNGNLVSFPNIDPLPGRTEFGRSDSLPFYWDHLDTNPKKRGEQGMKASEARLLFPGEKQIDRVPAFLDGPIDRRRASLRFVTFLVLRDPQLKKFDLLAGFQWTFHEGASKPGFNNGDESVSGVAQVQDLVAAVKVVRQALTNSRFTNWNVYVHQTQKTAD